MAWGLARVTFTHRYNPKLDSRPEMCLGIRAKPVGTDFAGHSVKKNLTSVKKNLTHRPLHLVYWLHDNLRDHTSYPAARR